MAIRTEVVTAETKRYVCSKQYCTYTELNKKPSLTDHIQKIKSAIEKNNAQKLQDYLTYSMQYRDILKIEEGYWELRDDYQVYSRYWIESCPVIEGLLHLHPQELSEIVKMIADQNNKALYEAFAKSLAFASLSENNLVAWDNNIKNKLEINISQFKKYAEEKLVKQDPIKAQAVVDVVTVLTEKINFLETRSYHDIEGCGPLLDTPTFLARLRTLQFKLEFQAVLHSKDDVLSRHRSYARFASNIFSILFTGGILNVVNYAVNRRFWFFSQTQTQNMVAGIEKTVFRP